MMLRTCARRSQKEEEQQSAKLDVRLMPPVSPVSIQRQRRSAKVASIAKVPGRVVKVPGRVVEPTARYFTCVLQNSRSFDPPLPANIEVAVHATGLDIVKRRRCCCKENKVVQETAVVLVRFPYSRIDTWGHSKNFFAMLTPGKPRSPAPIKYTFATKQGEDIVKAIVSNVDAQRDRPRRLSLPLPPPPPLSPMAPPKTPPLSPTPSNHSTTSINSVDKKAALKAHLAEKKAALKASLAALKAKEAGEESESPMVALPVQAPSQVAVA